VIPSHWLGYRRIDDGELLGYVVPTDGALFTPVTVFGYPLGPPPPATTQSGDWTGAQPSALGQPTTSTTDGARSTKGRPPAAPRVGMSTSHGPTRAGRVQSVVATPLLQSLTLPLGLSQPNVAVVLHADSIGRWQVRPQRKQSGSPSAPRGYGPDVGEPPPLVDPRRWGSLIGLIGGLVFIGSYSSVLGGPVSTVAWVAGVALVLAALLAHCVRPVSLGPLTRPGPLAVATYGGCVVGEFALIALGSRALTAAGHSGLRPALIAAVVGFHFIPFAWAFGERMFYWLGDLLVVLGAAGLVAGAMGVAHAAEVLAVVAGLAMLVIIALYAMGRFAPQPSTKPAM